MASDPSTAPTDAAPRPTRTGVWATIGEPRLAAALEATGFDWVCLDGQHGHFDDRAVRETLALRGKPAATVLTRVLRNDVGLIGRALDAGADGVIVPMVQSAAEAEDVVRAAHYSPRGARSFGPMHGAAYGTTTGLPGRAMSAVMVETQVALDAVDDIARTPDLDMIFVGPFDLSLALGRDIDDVLADRSPDAPLPRVVAACRAAGIVPGAFAGDPRRARAIVEHGFEWVAVTSDVGLLHLGAAEARHQLG
ncbi:HpcH/HpaI aldolase family protein [Cumulibacter manganitolerans]|uniref:HpcH/HpaI aldolase family protein n=1 Tax=Cumulibacter manganitolerans TaxID=1884992 RepID=UPI001885D902|nr:aldolase/citrate lyase family protein [Cumulibacter manganitolerans]